MTAIEKRHRLFVPDLARVAIMLVGCGGTGSYAALHLAQLASTAPFPVDLVFVDPDIVEVGNLGRQNFCPAEVSQPKAATLARRYGYAYGLAITSVVERFEPEMVKRYRAIQEDYAENVATILVGCVDNAAARLALHQATHPAHQRTRVEGNLYWLDAGNDHNFGQIIIGNSPAARPQANALGAVVALPLPSVQEPGLLRDDGDAPAGDSCAELVAAGVQARTVNKMMAAWLDVYLERLLVSRDLDFMRTVLDQRSGTAHSYAITGVEVVEGRKVVDPEPHPYGEACPTCGSVLVDGFDEVNGRTVDILFCGQCDYRTTLEDDHTLRVAEIVSAL